MARRSTASYPPCAQRRIHGSPPRVLLECWFRGVVIASATTSIWAVVKLSALFVSPPDAWLYALPLIPLLSFLYTGLLINFGYHFKHHESPHAPWWRLPYVCRRLRKQATMGLPSTV